jgi:hypothetical protein
LQTNWFFVYVNIYLAASGGASSGTLEQILQPINKITFVKDREGRPAHPPKRTESCFDTDLGRCGDLERFSTFDDAE